MVGDGYPEETYDRQLSVPGFGPQQQRRLATATVAVCGVGGVGGAAATYLAAAGVGRLLLIHPGDLEAPDLNRQTLMEPAALGTPRVECAARTLRRHHPGVMIETYDRVMADPVVAAVLARADAVVDARHNFPERYLLNRLCRAAGTPLVIPAMSATEAQLMVVDGDGPCLRCVFGEGDPSWQPLGFPVIGAVAGTVGCLAAMEVIKLVAGYGQPLRGRMLTMDLLDMSFRTLRIARQADCPDCADGDRSGGAASGCANRPAFCSAP